MAEGAGPVYAPVMQAGGDTFGGGVLAGAALKTSGGYGYDGVMDVAAGGICDLREQVSDVKAEVKDAECNIRHDVKDAEGSIRRDLKDSEANVREKITDVRFQVAQTGKEVENRVSDLERNVDAQFCRTNEIVKTEGSLGRETTLREANATREKVAELARWRDDKEESRFLRTWDRQERLEDRIEKEGEKTRVQLHAFEKDVADRFCKENERELQSKIDELRLKVQCCECRGPEAGEIADTVIQRLVNLNILGSQGLK